METALNDFTFPHARRDAIFSELVQSLVVDLQVLALVYVGLLTRTSWTQAQHNNRHALATLSPRHPAVAIQPLYKHPKIFDFLLTHKDQSELLPHPVRRPGNPLLMCDPFHYNPRGQAIVASLVINLLTTALRVTPAPAAASASARPPRRPRAKAARAPRTALCAVGAELQGLALAGLDPPEGWGWRVEGTPQNPKPRFVSLRPGGTLVLGPVAFRTPWIYATVGYLKSYSGHGMFHVASPDCRVAVAPDNHLHTVADFPRVDTHHALRMSLSALVMFHLLKPANRSDLPACTLALTHLPEAHPQSAGHKAKVLSLHTKAPKTAFVGNQNWLHMTRKKGVEAWAAATDAPAKLRAPLGPGSGVDHEEGPAGGREG